MKLVWVKDLEGWGADSHVGPFRIEPGPKGGVNFWSPWHRHGSAPFWFETEKAARDYAQRAYDDRIAAFGPVVWWPGFVTGLCTGIVMGAGLVWWLTHGL